MHCPHDAFVPVALENTSRSIRGSKMASLQTDFPVISTESAIERLEREMKSRCFCRRAVLKNLRIERVGVVDVVNSRMK